MALPYITLYIGDVKKDTDLLSPAAFGAYMRLLLFHMHEAKPVRGEVTFTLPQLTKIFGTETHEQTMTLIAEIINPQFEIVDYIPTEDNRHFIRNRRMVREGQISKVRSEAGSKGGKKTQEKNKQNDKQNSSNETSKDESVVTHEISSGTGDAIISSKLESKNEANGAAGLVIEAKTKQVIEAKENQNSNTNNNINSKIEEDRVEGKEETNPGPQINKGMSVLIVPELASIFTKHRRTYQIDPAKDYQPLRLIGEAIAKAEGVSAYELAGIDQIKETWEAIVEFTLTHNLYRNFQLSQIEKYFQTICENMRNNGLSGSTITSNNTPPKPSIVGNNIKTAAGATELVKRKYGNNGQQ